MAAQIQLRDLGENGPISVIRNLELEATAAVSECIVCYRAVAY